MNVAESRFVPESPPDVLANERVAQPRGDAVAAAVDSFELALAVGDSLRTSRRYSTSPL